MPPTTPTAPSPPTPPRRPGTRVGRERGVDVAVRSARRRPARKNGLQDKGDGRGAERRQRDPAGGRRAQGDEQAPRVQRELAISKDAEEKAKIELRAVSNAKLEVDAAKTSMHEKQLRSSRRRRRCATLSSMHREHDGLKEQTKQLVLQADRAQETAQSKKQAAAALEASAARVEAIARRRSRARPPGKAARRGRGGGGRARAESQGSPGPGDGHDGVARGSEGRTRRVRGRGPDVPDIPRLHGAGPGVVGEERRAAAACFVPAYGVPADLFGPLLEQVQETAGAPSARSRGRRRHRPVAERPRVPVKRTCSKTSQHPTHWGFRRQDAGCFTPRSTRATAATRGCSTRSGRATRDDEQK